MIGRARPQSDVVLEAKWTAVQLLRRAPNLRVSYHHTSSIGNVRKERYRTSSGQQRANAHGVCNRLR